MSIFNRDGTELDSAYNKNGTQITHYYDINGNEYSFDDSYIVGRTIVWEDDFNSFNDENWGYEIGNQRNTELQCYRAENVSIENGVCVLTAKRENYGGKEWTSGSITSMGKKHPKYGRIEAKIKFPCVSGSFPAFWMLGENIVFHYVDGATGQRWTTTGTTYPQCGECDIVEMFGVVNYASSTLYKYNGGSFGTKTSTQALGNIDITQWHKYALEWTYDYMAMYVDGIEYARFATGDNEDVQAYQLPMNLKLNLAVGAAGGTPSAETNEMKMYIDWVRVYAPLES